MTPVNARPIEIQMADSIAASLTVITCAVRCTSSRSTTTRTTMNPTRASQCHSSTFRYANCSRASASSAATLANVVTALSNRVPFGW